MAHTQPTPTMADATSALSMVDATPVGSHKPLRLCFPPPATAEKPRTTAAIDAEREKELAYLRGLTESLQLKVTEREVDLEIQAEQHAEERRMRAFVSGEQQVLEPPPVDGTTAIEEVMLGTRAAQAVGAVAMFAAVALM